MKRTLFLALVLSSVAHADPITDSIRWFRARVAALLAPATGVCPTVNAATLIDNASGTVGLATLPMSCVPPTGMLTILLDRTGRIVATIAPGAITMTKP